MMDRPGPVSDTSKILAALSYPIWIVGLIAILIEPYKDEKFVRFHAIQGLATGLGGYIAIFVASMIFGFIPVIGWILDLLLSLAGIALFIYLILMAVKAYKGEYFEVPIGYGFLKDTIG